MKRENTLTSIIAKTDQLSELVIFSGKSGSGKTTLLNELIRKYNGINLPQACSNPWESTPILRIRKAQKITTRGRRIDDDQNEFIYVSSSEFEALRDNGIIAVQYRSEGSGNFLYGWSAHEITPRPNEIVVTPANDDAVAIDLKHLRQSTNIFVDVPDDVLTQRILSRGGTQEQVTGRIEKLQTEYRVIGHVRSGAQKIIGLKEQFYGGADQLQGIADIIVENTADVETISELLFREILKIANEKKHRFRIPAQRIIGSDKNNNAGVLVQEARPENYARPSGKSFQLGELLEKNRPEYKGLVTLGGVRGAVSGLIEPRYFIRISEMGQEINEFDERSIMFRGGVLRPIEHWAISSKSNKWDLMLELSRFGMQQTRSFAGNGRRTINVTSNYMDGVTSYRDVRNIFVNNGLERLV